MPESRRPIYFLLAAAMILWIGAVIHPVKARAGSEPVIKVLVNESKEQVLFRGKKLQVLRLSDNRWTAIVGGLSRASVSYRNGLVALDGTSVREGQLAVHSKSGTVTVSGRKYKGRILILPDGGGLAVVNEVPLEKYLAGLVNAEISSKWPMEAVKAQVVAARTYALYKMGKSEGFYHLRSDVSDQVYLGAAAEDKRALKAVRSTRGEVLKYGNELIPAFYHSNCGGITADAADVWGVPHPALKSTECSFCSDAPYGHWRLTLSWAELQKAINGLYPGTGRVKSITVRKRSGDGRVTILAVVTEKGRILVDSGDFRKEVGYDRLPSTLFRMGGGDGNVIFEGRGFGHGVGLCQWGAKGASERGWDYVRILGKFYRDAVVKRVY
ncbi:MAG: SpoIID/LytB domain-containing protein [bacterium]